jgi:hypothetical protein
MDRNTAVGRIARADAALKAAQPGIKRRENYVRGEQDLPFAPMGVNAEYEDLREQSVSNFLGIAVDAPVQRMGVDSITTALGEDADKRIWAGAWQANRMDTRQVLPYRSMMIHGRGIVGVWPNLKNRDKPIVRPQSIGRVHIEMDPDDPFTPLWAAKMYQVEESESNGLILPGSVKRTKDIAVVYDDKGMIRFERGGLTGTGAWVQTDQGTHPMGRVPFALLDFKPDPDGRPWSAIDGLMAQQDAINTIRFNTLLAMQFAAFRQRIITGFDPRVVDKDGNVVYKTNTDGTPMVDANGNMIPMVSSPGRVGVDRLMAFPGGDTKVFDLPESNLANYIAVYDKFLTTFFSTAQIPPQYLLSQMANLSGDALAAAESTLASLVQQMQLTAGEGIEDVAALAWTSMGQTEEFPATAETNWADREARSFSATADAITKLISVEFPHRSAFGMLPGATKQKLDDWMDERQAEQDEKSILTLATRPFRDATDLPTTDGAVVPPEKQITDGAPAAQQ